MSRSNDPENWGRGDTAGSRVAALSVVSLASVTVLLQTVAANAGTIQLSLPMVLPALLGWTVAVAWVSWIHRSGGDLKSASFAGAIGALLLTGAGHVVDSFGWLGPLIPLVVIPAVHAVFWRVRRTIPLDWLWWWTGLTLLLVNGLYVIEATVLAPGDEEVIRQPATRVISSDEAHPDVVVLILDEFASIDNVPIGRKAERKLQSLRKRGYEVRETLWSPYTISMASIAAILDGSYPVVGGEFVDPEVEARLGRVTQGSHRLASTLSLRGYRFTMVESGLWLTTCSGVVDSCVRDRWLDEAVEMTLERSVLREPYRRLTGDAFVMSGLYAMEQVSGILSRAAMNGERDLVFAHIMLPHRPYILDENCEAYGDSLAAEEPTWRGRAEAYAAQASCVVDWLTTTLAGFDDLSDVQPVVVVTGDHGTALSGQMGLPMHEWTEQDVVERLGAFAAFRFPEGCQIDDIVVSAQLVDVLLACLQDESPTLGARTFVSSYGGNTGVSELSVGEFGRNR